MPYITQKERDKFDSHLEEIAKKIEAKGDLTYCVYVLGLEYIKKFKPSYQIISDAISALNDAAFELRRQILNPYEEKKIQKNGGIE